MYTNMEKVNTGKALIVQYNAQDNIVLVDIYADGELLVEDMDKIHKAIESFDVQIPVDTICIKSGKNHFSHDALEYSIKHSCIHNKVVYVIKHMSDIHFPTQAQETFLKGNLVDYCTSIEDAYYLLK